MLMMSCRQQRILADCNLDQRLRANLRGHWIGGCGGNTWFDVSGYGNHGTLTGFAVAGTENQWTLNRDGSRQALKLDGSNDRVAIPSITFTGVKSVAFWICFLATPNCVVLGGAATNYFPYIDSTVIAIFDASNSGNITHGGFTTGAWYHIALSSMTVGTLIYKNGVLLGTISGNILPTVTSIGAYADATFPLNGIIDDFRVYTNRSLSAVEVNLLADRQFNPVNFPRYQVARCSGISYDAVSNSGYQAASSSYSWSHTCTGTNRYLAVDIATLSVPGTTVSGVTYNSVALSLIGSKSSGVGTQHVEQWGLANPASGTNTIAVTLSASVVSIGEAVSYSGVHQALPTEAFNSATALNSITPADASVSITSVANKCWLHGVCASDDATITANQTSRNNVTGATGSALNQDTGPVTPAGATTLSVTNIGAAQTWVIAGYAIRPITALSNSYTATTTLTGGSSTLSSSDTFSPGTHTATAALSGTKSILASTDTFSPGTHTAVVSLTKASSTLAVNATFSPGTHTTSSSLSGKSTTLSANLTNTNPIYSATVNLLGSHSTLIGSVSFVKPVYSASVSLNVLGSVLLASTTFIKPTYTAGVGLVTQSTALASTVVHTRPTFGATVTLLGSSSVLSAVLQFSGSVTGGRLLNLRRRIMSL